MINRAVILDARCPLNWVHPLNQGLVGEWTIPPLAGWRGGLTFRDLVRGGRTPHDGTLTNMAFPATATSGWQGPRGRPGGYGSLAFDGTDDYALTSLSVIGAVTVACWVKLGTVNAFGYILGQTGNFFGIRVPSGTTPTLCDDLVDIGTVAIGTGWARLLGVFDGVNGTLYVNGEQSGTHASTITGWATMQVGGRNGIGSNPQQCLVDGVCLWSRAFSANQARADYTESRRGNLGRWNWLSRRSWFIPSVAATNSFNAAWAQQSNVLIGGGCV